MQRWLRREELYPSFQPDERCQTMTHGEAQHLKRKGKWGAKQGLEKNGQTVATEKKEGDFEFKRNTA